MDEELKKLVADGHAHWWKGDYDGAIPILRRALNFAEASYGDDAKEVIEPLYRLAAALAPPSRGRKCHEEAVTLLRRALEVSEICFGENSPKLIRVLSALALDLWGLERHEEAFEQIGRALEISEKIYGEDWHTGDVLGTMTDLLLGMDRHAEALAYAERLGRIRDRFDEPADHPTLLSFSLMLGRCLLGVGRNVEALVHLERSLAMILTKRPDADSPLLDELRGWIEMARKGSCAPSPFAEERHSK